jgi:type IV pilus assembly protein PilA
MGSTKILKLRQRMAQEESGFTLVELLVVMLILGLLAAIAIPAFFNQRDKAKDADAKTAVRTAETSMETYATDHDGKYGGADAAALVAIEPTLADADLQDPVPATGPGDDADNSYTVTVLSSNTPNEFRITRHSTGTTELECDDAENDGCPASTDADPAGEWG